jgi:hypothetical protein
MQTHFLPSLTLAALLLAAPLATAQEDDHEAHHPEGTELPEGPSAPAGMMGQGMMGEGMMEMMTPEMMQMMMRMMRQGMMPEGMMPESMMEQRGMPGMMRQGMPRQGMGQGMGEGMGQGMGQGMGPGMMGQMRMGMPGGDSLLYGSPHLTPEEMTPERVRELLEQRLDYHGNPRLELGEIEEAADGSITAVILTTDGSLVQKLAFNRYPGLVRQLDDQE